MRKVKLLLSPGGSEVGLLYSETECLVVTLTSGVSVPVTLEGGEVLCATNSPAGDFQLVTRYIGMSCYFKHSLHTFCTHFTYMLNGNDFK